MIPELAQLRDIHGIDAVPWWPPAPGWWLILAAAVLLILIVWKWRSTLRLRIPIPGITRGDWRWDAARQLRALRRRAKKQPSKATAGELSELLRRVAMARIGRDACAGLTGTDWLEWLQANDPKGFRWQDEGGILLDLPYAPPDTESGGAELIRLIKAAHDWVAAEN